MWCVSGLWPFITNKLIEKTTTTRTYGERAEDARVDGGGTDGVVGAASGRCPWTSENEGALRRVNQSRRQHELVS